MKLTTLAFVNVKSHVATPFTASLYVHVIVYVVHHFLHATALLVNVTVGHNVSIPLTLTVTSFVEFSLSFIVITQLSVHVLLLFGVYVITFPFIAQLHLLPFVFTLAVNDPFPQFHSAALLKLFQSHVFALFPTLLFNVKLFAVGATLLTVHVAS